ncbi:MAG: esterase/lipase family protein [Rhodopila sp.]
MLATALSGCATPIHVVRMSQRDVQRELTTNIISNSQLSSPTEIVLHRHDLWELFESDPERAMATLHGIVTSGEADPDGLFALAEMSFHHAQDSGKRSYYLAAAVYAIAFLFPDDPTRSPNKFDPDVRVASDLYNRSLTSAFASADGSRVELRSGTYELPFGKLDVTYDAATAHWGHFALSDFVPADELHITGLSNRYRQRGIGAPLAAEAAAAVTDVGFEVTQDVGIPVTALLRIDVTRQNLATGQLQGRVEIYPAYEPSTVEIRGQPVPLEVDTSAAFAYGLSDPKIWQGEFAGFLHGDYFDKDRSPIEGLEPYRPGQIPILFIHGTGSSTARWAGLINDLESDPLIRRHFQFWWYSYSTSNPLPLSALRLRIALEDAVRKVDPEGKDAALKQGVLIAHSQGGLLAKMLVIDSGPRLWDAISTKPLDAMKVSNQTRDTLRQALFVKPVPEVRSVIFIATPHHGSFIAGSLMGRMLARLATMPTRIAGTLHDALSGNPDAIRFSAAATDLGSVWWVTPGNPVVEALAAIPVAPGISAHSIIAVQGDGPPEAGDDGVVTYRSAHVHGVESELVVRSDHSVQSNPHTVAEVRRILLQQLAAACSQGMVVCDR